MSPDILLMKTTLPRWVAKTKVAPVKFTKWFLFILEYLDDIQFVLLSFL